MLESKVISRKLSTAFHTLQNEGFGRFFALIRLNADLWREYLELKKHESVTLDGCTFDLRQISSISMGRALLDGQYENFERRAVQEHVRPEYPVVELGGCIGVVACITNRLLMDRRSHVVVEASPSVIPILQQNRDRNHCEFEILNRAIAYDQPAITFAETTNYWGNALRTTNSESMVTVGTTRLRDIVTERGYGSFTLICDIEGHEYDLIRHEADVLQKAHTIILETHARLIGEAKTQELLERLKEIGFSMIEKESFVLVLKRSPVSA